MASLLSTKKQGNATLSCSAEVLKKSGFFITFVLGLSVCLKKRWLGSVGLIHFPIEFELSDRFKSFLEELTPGHRQVRKSFWFYGRRNNLCQR